VDVLSVWANNASQWGDDTNQFENIPFHQTAATREFLNESDRRFFICGLKGIGKTLLLQKKSVKMRNDQPGLVLLPATQPIEKLTPLFHSMSDQDVKELSAQTGWYRVWLFALSLSIVRRLIDAGVLSHDVISTAVTSTFPLHTAAVSYHIDHLLRLGQHDRRRLIETESETLLAHVRSVHTGVAVFVDAIEDCVYSHMGPDLARYENRSKTNLGILAASVWRAAQVGFVRAAVTLHESNRHVKVFGALRREAFESDIVPDRQNLEPYLLNLEYSREDLRGIFRTKLAALRKESPHFFTNPHDEDVTRAFFGYATLIHPTVSMPNLQALEEPVLDYIIRHSRGRPRELDLVGESLQYGAERPRTPDAVRRSVREKSKSWLGWARSEMIPYWREDYDRFLNALPSNVLSKEALHAAMDETGLARTSPEALRDLFELGLLGCVVPDDQTGALTQRFRQNDPELPVTAELFDASSYYVVHPCVNLATRALKARYEPDPNNVVGHGYGFVPSSRRFHVHFGLGALGAGLVLPAIARAPGTSIVVIQRKSPRWKLARKWSGTCTVTHRVRLMNDGVLRLLQSLEGRAFVGTPRASELDSLIEWWESGKGHVVLVTNHVATIKRFLLIATSVSTAVREETAIRQIGKMIAASTRGHLTAVYPFENDEKTIEALNVSLSKSNVPLIRVSADRICKDDVVGESGVSVDAEDYYRIVIADNSVESRALFGGANLDDRHSVLFERDKRRFVWEAEAKRLLVNGVHFAYVVYAFRRLNHLYSDRRDVIKILVEAPVTELLVTQEVQEALDQIAALYMIHLLVEAENAGLVATVRDVETLFAHLMKLHDMFGERLSATRDYMQRILKPDAKAIDERVRRFGGPFEDLVLRLSRSPRTSQFYRAKGFDTSRVERDVQGFREACFGLLGYLAQSAG
jgi:hypothetical protein